MAERFARLMRETLAHPWACAHRGQSPARGRVRHRISRDGGQTMGEYAIILGLVAAIAAAAFTTLGPILAAAVQSAGAAF